MNTNVWEISNYYYRWEDKNERVEGDEQWRRMQKETGFWFHDIPDATKKVGRVFPRAVLSNAIREPSSCFLFLALHVWITVWEKIFVLHAQSGNGFKVDTTCCECKGTHLESRLK